MLLLKVLFLSVIYSTLAIAEEAPPTKVPLDYPSIPSAWASKGLLLDIETQGANIFAAGHRGHIIMSDDNGKSWKQIQTPTSSTLTDIYFADDKNAWAIGHYGVILRSKDGGLNWERVRINHKDPGPLLGINFQSPNDGIIIGAYGFKLSSSDGGKTWEEGYFYGEDDFHLNHIEEIGTNLLVVGEAGSVYQQSEGNRFIKLLPPYQGSFFGSLSFDEKSLVFGIQGNLLAFEKSSEAWSTINSGLNTTITDAIMIKDSTGNLNQILLVSSSGEISMAGKDRLQFRRLKNHRVPFQPSAFVRAKDGSIVVVGEKGVYRIEKIST